MKLTAKNVQDLYWSCHLDPQKPQTGTLKTFKGIGTITDLWIEKVNEQREAIAALLSQLPASFYDEQRGGELSFMAGYDQDWNMWSEHESVTDMLIILGLAVDMVSIKQLGDNVAPSLIIKL